jgi:Zn-dependent protease
MDFKTSPQERFDLLVSWVMLSLAFAFLIFRNGNDLVFSVLVGFIAVGTGFVFHELAHRQAARHYGFHSEYRAWYPLLVLALVLSVVTGWILAAPGATYFFGNRVSKKQNGIISLAGPATNLVLGTVMLSFLLLLLTSKVYVPEFNLAASIIYNVVVINFFFAFFNLLPIAILDGTKIITWNPKIWFVSMATATLLLGFTLFFL